MNSSYKEGSEAYNLLIQNRKRLWYTLFSTFQNVSAKSDDVAMHDLPLSANQPRRRPNTSYTNTKNLSVTLNSTNDDDLSADDLDAVSDTNNEDFDDDASDAGGEDVAKFSDSDDENELLLHSRMKHILVYESDSDEDLSDDLDENNDNENDKDSLDECFDETQNLRGHDENEDVDDASECSDDDDDENAPQNEDYYQSQRKRTFMESGLGNDSLEEKPPVKKMNFQLKNINIYINANESDFETDSE